MNTKIFPVFTVAYPMLEMFNTIKVTPNVDEARMNIEITGRQIILKPGVNGDIEYIVDGPDLGALQGLRGTHGIIRGDLKNNKDIFLNEKNGKWTCQAKIMFPRFFDTLKEAHDNPILTLEQDCSSEENVSYFTRIKLTCMRVNKAKVEYTNLNPSPVWDYRFILRKEIIRKEDNVEKVFMAQNKIYRTNEPIVNNQEYYFFIKEDNGVMSFEVQKTYLSQNEEIKGGILNGE